MEASGNSQERSFLPVAVVDGSVAIEFASGTEPFGPLNRDMQSITPWASRACRLCELNHLETQPLLDRVHEALTCDKGKKKVNRSLNHPSIEASGRPRTTIKKTHELTASMVGPLGQWFSPYRVSSVPLRRTIHLSHARAGPFLLNGGKSLLT